MPGHARGCRTVGSKVSLIEQLAVNDLMKSACGLRERAFNTYADTIST